MFLFKEIPLFQLKYIKNFIKIYMNNYWIELCINVTESNLYLLSIGKFAEKCCYRFILILKKHTKY